MMCASPCTTHTVRFTGKERDGETGLDYFGARYMSAAQGRFTSADAPFADQNVGDPQSWNLYTYVRNNPLRHVDDNGAGAREAAQGAWQGTKNFTNNTVTGLVNLASGLVTDPVGTVGGVVSDIGDTLSLAGQTYFTSEGRAGLAASFSAMSDEERGAIITESLLVGVSTVLGPKGIKAGAGAISDATQLTRVGRWMGESEFTAMKSTGMVQESTTGTTHVTLPANPSAYRAAKPGSVYTEFSVPKRSVKPTQPGWGKIVGPNSLEGRLAAKKGQPVPQMPPAKKIKLKTLEEE